jgi:hypothetical protein
MIWPPHSSDTKTPSFAARTAGFSWTEIGRLLGVSRQQVHRKFGRAES